MRNIMNEWEVQKVANNLDRINDYSTSGSTNYIDPSQLTETLSEWEVQKIANNLDRINDYRSSGRSLEQSLLALAFYGIFFAIVILVGLFSISPELGVFVTTTLVVFIVKLINRN